MAPSFDVKDPTDLAEAGWGVLFAEGTSAAVRKALQPLLEHRRNQAKGLYREVSVPQGSTARRFLQSVGSKLNARPTPKQFPYYLLLVGGPEQITFRFQSELDVQYAVGRIFFDTAEEYAAYAQGVVSAEAKERPTPRSALVASPSSSSESRFLSEDIAAPLSEILKRSRPESKIETVSGQAATTATLIALLEGCPEKADLLAIFAAGASFPFGDQRQRTDQGAVISSDWTPKHPLDHKGYAAAGSLARTNQRTASSIIFMFGDYSTGSREVELDGIDETGALKSRRVAPRPFVSALSQNLLTNGARAVIGLVGRITSSHATWNTDGIHIQGFSAVFRQILDGFPVGWAMESFGTYFADLSAIFHSLREDRAFFKPSDHEIFRDVFESLNDLSNLMLLGDPAVYLNTESSRISVEISENAPRLLNSRALGNLAGADADIIAKEDSLQFRAHVFALADLIDSPETALPLTIGIFGPWGSGKSTLLEFLIKEMGPTRLRDARPKGEVPSPAIHPIRFNAWEYSASEVIWPALARIIVDELERFLKVRWYEKLFRNLRLQFSLHRGLVATGCIATISGLVALSLDSGSDFRKFWGAILALGGIGLAKIVYDSVNNSFGQWVTTLFQGRSYGQPLDFFPQIKDEFSWLNSKLSERNARVLVTIDDLDRCEPTKAVEVLQAVHLLLRFERMIVCMALDPQLLVCAIEKYFDGLLGDAGSSGLEYLDKIIQIPVRIPKPQSDEVRDFLTTLLGSPEPSSAGTLACDHESVETKKTKKTSQSVAKRDQPASPPIDISALGQGESNARRVAFSWEEAETFDRLAIYLRPNPRYLKRFVNVYRLVRSVAAHGGGPSFGESPRAMVGWLAISSRWPSFATKMAAQVHKLQGIRASNPKYVLPSENALAWVFDQVCRDADKIEAGSRDGSLEELARLVAFLTGPDELKVEWTDLWRILRFTANFNPAIEFDWGTTWLEDHQESTAASQPTEEAEEPIPKFPEFHSGKAQRDPLR
jgi:hypothetical protein